MKSRNNSSNSPLKDENKLTGEQTRLLPLAEAQLAKLEAAQAEQK